MRIAVSADERGHLVDAVLRYLEDHGHTVTYLGPEGDDGLDWPEVSAATARLVSRGDVDEGIVMCWTGTGATLAANKIHGVRAALCQDAETARGARIWNHANVLGLSLRATSEPIAREILDAWFDTRISDDEWNLRMIARIQALDDERQ